MPTTIKNDGKLSGFTDFEKKINKCLSLLDTKASNYRKWMDSYNLAIRPYSKSGANFGDKAIDIGLDTFKTSETWLASVLIHETIHFWQYRSGKYDAKKSTEMEIDANKYQMIVLKAIGAPQNEISHLASQTGTHADTNGDGVYDEKDYENRTY